jgi:hypothetical protein
MATKRFPTVAVLLTCLAAAGAAADSPLAVSPGDTSKVIAVEGRCPTFSWAAEDAAPAYELVVYRLGTEARDAAIVLDHRLPGSARSWTPSLDRCLERGRRYAWSIRAVDGSVKSEWSSPSLFEVSRASSLEEIEEMLSLIRQGAAAGYGDDVESLEPGVRQEITASNVETSPSTASLGPPAAISAGAGIVVNGNPVVSGWQYVTSHAFVNCSVGSSCCFFATCPAGKKLLGGGIQAEFSQNCRVESSAPILDTQWEGCVSGVGPPCNARAWAICAVVE